MGIRQGLYPNLNVILSQFHLLGFPRTLFHLAKYFENAQYVPYNEIYKLLYEYVCIE